MSSVGRTDGEPPVRRVEAAETEKTEKGENVRAHSRSTPPSEPVVNEVSQRVDYDRAQELARSLQQEIPRNEAQALRAQANQSANIVHALMG